MKELTNGGDANRDTIRLYLQSEPGSVQLTDKQKELLARWSYADETIRSTEVRKREVIAQMIMNKFTVSKQTAYQDIVNAEDVFSSSTPLNKKYRVQLRIEFLETKIDELYEAKEYIAAVMLEKTLQKFYQDYPDITPPRSPKNIVFNVQNNIMPAPGMSAEEALQKARNIINLKPNNPDAGAA